MWTMWFKKKSFHPLVLLRFVRHEPRLCKQETGGRLTLGFTNMRQSRIWLISGFRNFGFLILAFRLKNYLV
jgi:hypothetical protein